MEREHLQNPDVNRSHEPRQPVGRGVLTASRPGGLETARPTVRFMGRIPRNYRALNPEPGRDGALRRPRLNLVGTARCAVRAALSGAMMPPAASRAGTSQRDVPTKVRFMESFTQTVLPPLSRSLAFLLSLRDTAFRE